LFAPQTRGDFLDGAFREMAEMERPELDTDEAGHL
jgi:hypothetical protein